jgi:hypothetical protein
MWFIALFGVLWGLCYYQCCLVRCFCGGCSDDNELTRHRTEAEVVSGLAIFLVYINSAALRLQLPFVFKVISTVVYILSHYQENRTCNEATCCLPQATELHTQQDWMVR